MKTLYLNPEIYSRISDPAVNKDKAAQRKQRQTVKVTIPLMKAIVSLKKVEAEIKKKTSPDTFDKLKSILPQLHQSFRVLNASFTGIQRKRREDVCSSLERHFKQFSQSDSFEQYLFEEPAIKRIRAEMKNSDNNKQRPQFSSYPSKNWSSSQKTPKGATLQGHQHLQQTATQDISTTKQEKGLLKQVNLNIDISELHIKADKFQGGNLRNNFLSLDKNYIRYINFKYCTAKFYRKHSY